VNETPRTTLTAFSPLYQKDKVASTLLYCDVPKYYTGKASEKACKRRVQGIIVPEHPVIKATDALGRVCTAHSNNFECFFLLLLLHTIRGATSFTALRTVNGQICGTFAGACQRMGPFEYDAQWDATMAEAALAQSSAKLRNLFALALITCGPSNLEQLWDSYKKPLTEDFLLQTRQRNPGIALNYTSGMFKEGLLIMVGKYFKQLSLSSQQRNRGDRFSREMLREKSRWNNLS
jgi:hypothetical protein